MKRQITFRLIAMLLTATLLLSSTGLLSMFAQAEGSTSPTLVTEGSTAASLEMNTEEVATTTEPESTTVPETTTAPETTTQAETTAAPETTTVASGNADPTVAAEGGVLTPTGPKVNAESFQPANAAPQDQVWAGDGTSGNPYQVSSTAHFLDMHRIVNDLSSADKYFILTTDIDLSGLTVSSFKAQAGFNASLMCINPAYDSSDPGKAYIKLNGANHRIHDFNVTNNFADTIAIFGYLNPDSIIENINFDNCSLTVTNQLSWVNAIVAVQNKGLIRNCTFTGNPLATTLSMDAVGGPVDPTETFTINGSYVLRVGHSVFVGDNQGTIQNCRMTDISITIDNRRFVGAVAGQNSGVITGINGASFLANYGLDGITVTANDSTQKSEQIGAIVGKNRPLATVSNCAVNLPGTNTGDAFTGGSKVGGIAGANAGTVSNCYVLGKVTSSGTVSATEYDMKGSGSTFGGITGENAGSINNCSAVNIGMYFSGTNYPVYGGIAGANSGDGVTTGLISNSFASGKQSDFGIIAGTIPDYYLGGIIGSASAGTLLSSCYALVSLSPNAVLAGALIGKGANNNMLSAVNPNYWSRTVSGWQTQCALNGADDFDIQRGINVLKIGVNEQATIYKNQFSHSWGSATVEIPFLTLNNNIFTVNSSNITKTSESTSALRLLGGPTSGTFGFVYYNLDITLPAGVGATQQPMITQRMSFTAVVTAEVLSYDYVVTLANPIIITNAFEMLLLRDVNYTHYVLNNNITMPTVSPNEWRTSIFSGTLDGAGNTITTHIPLFSKIYGSRDNTVPAGGGTDSASNLAYGYINNLHIILNTNSSSGVLGSVMGGTVKNVTLTGSNGNINLGIVPAAFSDLGGFINAARGNTYVYGCYTDLKLVITNSTGGGYGGLIGKIDGEKVTVENCGSNADIFSGSALSSIGSLIGTITNSTGTVKNCFAAGLVERGGNIAVGNKLTTHLLENVYWSVKNLNETIQATNTGASNISGADTLIKWNFDENTGYVSVDSSYINLILPAPITMLSTAQLDQFTVTVRDAGQIIVGALAIVNNKLTVEISKDPASVVDTDTVLTVVHQTTGLVSRIIIDDGIGKVGDYYLIKTPGDLQYLTANQYFYTMDGYTLTSESGYLTDGTGFMVKLMADIDMSGYEYTPIGRYQSGQTAPLTKAFKGVFDGNGFTISNLTITDDPVTPTGKVGMFAYTEGATITNLTLENMTVTSGNQYAGCVTAVMSAGLIDQITIKNSLVTSSFNPGNGSTYTGGVVGGFVADTVNTATVKNVTVEGLTVSLTGSNAGFAGGIVGYIPSTPVILDKMDVTDLNITGKENIGGVAGLIAGGSYDVIIKGADLKATEGNTPLISGTGFVGGIVGQSTTNYDKAKITDCSLTGIAINNTGTTQTGNGATGGIAAWFSGTVGDDPATTGITEECVVTDCAIQGMIVGGIVGRIDTGTGNRNATIKNCYITGTTTITASTSEVPTAVAGGIFGEYLPTGTTGTLVIDTCRVLSGVTIANGRYAGGILASSAVVATPTKVEVKNCQSFAAVSTVLDTGTTYAGAIIGYCYANVNVTKITNCVGGGTVAARTGTGGLLGYMATSTAFNLATAGGPHISGCYVTASLKNTIGFSGKIWGYNSSTTCLTAANIADAVNIVIYSSYPENKAPYGRTSIGGGIDLPLGGYPNAPQTYADISRPDVANPTKYQHASNTPVLLTDTSRTATINATNLPANFTRTASFAYAADIGWVTQSERMLKVTSFSATQINVEAQRTSSDTGVIGVYRHATFDIYPSGTAEKITFQAKIPVNCQGINFLWTGAGTFADPFRITNIYDLDEMRNHVLTDDSVPDAVPYFGGYYRLENDLDFNAANELEGIFEPGGDFYNGGKYFVPIAGGAGKLPFVGTIIGNGKTITGLKMINTGGTYTGLFEQSGKQTVKLGGSDVTVSANFSNLTIDDAIIEGDNTFCTHAGTLVAYAKSTVFSGITVNNATVSKVTTYAGGIVGQAADHLTADSLCTLTNTTVNTSSVKVLSGGMAGGIAGRFGGTIGTVPTSGYDVQVLATTVEGDNAGGIVGYNFKLPLNITYALVSGGSVESKTTSDSYSAGGMLGRADGLGDNAVTITYSKLSNNPVKAVCMAGGVVGKMGVNPQTTGNNLLNIDYTQTNTAVETTGPGTGTSNAGGIAGNIDNALIVKIINSSAGGSVKGNKYVGGVIAYVEGTNPTLALTYAANSLVSHTVVGTTITGGAGALTGLILGNIDNALMPVGGTYSAEPFLDIKYSSYQYEPGRNMVGNSFINSMTNPDFKNYIYDLNKGINDTWIEPTYMGLRYDYGMTYFLSNDATSLDDAGLLLPVFPGAYGLEAGGTYRDFEDNQGQRFILDLVTSNIPNLVVYDKPNNTVARGTAEGAGRLVYQYENGLQLATELIAYPELEGNGNDKPFEISEDKYFALLRAFPSKNFIQTENITFDPQYFLEGGAYWNDGKLWEPVKGSGATTYFTGNYNGNGKIISGMQIARPAADDVGFFARIAQGASVYGLTIANATVAGSNYTGVLAGRVLGTGTAPAVSSCHVLNSTVTSTTAGTSAIPVQIGGLTAYEKSALAQPMAAGIENCTVISTTVTANQGNYTYAAGIATLAQRIENCKADNVTVSAGLYAAGIIVRSSITASGTGNPMLISGCEVIGDSGNSQISANYASATASAAGILAFINRRIQVTVLSCLVGAEVTVNCYTANSGGAAGGIVGTLLNPQANTDLTLSIVGSQSSAKVNGRVEAGGVLGAIRGATGAGLPLSNILIKGCVGGGEVTSTGTSATAGAGGIIGGMTVAGTNFAMPTGNFIYQNVASAFLTVQAGVPRVGRLVGNCTSINTWSYVAYPNMFQQNYISTYPTNPQPTGALAAFGNTAMMSQQGSDLVTTDLMYCQTGSDPAIEETFKVQNLVGGVPSGDFRAIAIATYGTGETNTTSFKAQLHVWNGVAPVELAANEPFTITPYHELKVTGVSIATANATASASFTGSGSTRALNIAVTPDEKTSGHVEVDLGYGLKVAVPLVTFEISGTGVSGNPFQLTTTEHLTLMYYLPSVYYIQMNDINIQPNAYLLNINDDILALWLNEEIRTIPIVGETVANDIELLFDGMTVETMTDKDILDIIIANDSIIPESVRTQVIESLKLQLYEGSILYQVGYTGFRSVGTAAKPFTGSYNGQNFKITGLYSSNKEIDNVGFFGYVAGTAALRNIHLELRANTATEMGGILGRTNVGGLAGYCATTVAVVNCSVAFGQVAGRKTVGGLIGRSSTSLIGCFTACDVLAVGYKGAGALAGEAGGLVGQTANNTTTAMNISKCFATGSVFSGNKHAGGLVGMVNNTSSSVINVTDSFFTGDVKSGDSIGAATILLGSGDDNLGIANGSRLYAAGTNVSFKGDMRPFSALGGTKTDIYYDNDMLGLTNTDQGTVRTTAQLTDGTLPPGFTTDTWSTEAGSYPRLIMKDSNSQLDTYANAFSTFAAIPLTIDSRELQNGNTLADGMRFQPQVKNIIGVQPVNFTASKLDMTDTLAYPTDENSNPYDPNLTGNGADRSIDLLFGSSGSSTTIYRNIFKSTVYPADTNDLLLYEMENGEIWYDCRTPVVTMTSSIDGITVARRVKIPLESTANKNFYIATERQFRALSNGYETANTKFSALVTAVDGSDYAARVKLTANVDLRGAEFTPIHLFKGIFDGNGFAVSKLKITKASTDFVGLFETLESFSPGIYVEVNNLNIEDVWITGRNNVGALTGNANVYSKISSCGVYPSGAVGVDASFVTGSERIGGLVGWAEGQISNQSRSAVSVNGVNSVGGLIGASSAIISKCFATGPVNASITPASAGINLYGVGGFAGAVTGGAISLSFATGNVTVSTVDDFLNNSKTIGIGGFAGVLQNTASMSASFASGSVQADDVGVLKLTAAAPNGLMFGIGGFSGVNRCQLPSCYSSSSVEATFNGEVLGTTGAKVAAGVGGISGIALSTVSDGYSSGSVLRYINTAQAYNSNTYFIDNPSTPALNESAIGGVIGTTAGVASSHTLIYFDLWNNSYGSTLTAIGGVADSEFIRSLTTDQLCISQAVRETNLTPLKLSTNMWSFNSRAYPCLLALIVEADNVTLVTPGIRYPAVLSVVAVTPDPRDTSARTGNGITMAITTPNSLTVLNQFYELEWEPEADSDVSFIETTEGTLSKFVPVRTANRSQILRLVAQIKDNGQYGTRSFDRSCADMRGTIDKPYLISNKSDLQHIGLSSIGTVGNYGEPGVNYSAIGFDDFYNQWYSPLNESFVNVSGKVYFQLLSDINMIIDVNYSYAGGKIVAPVDYDGDGNTANDNHYVGNLKPDNTAVVYKPGISFSGISFAGNDYSIDNFTSNREFLYGISDASDVRNVSFNNLNINSAGTADENSGTALVRYNLGIIDGCMIMSGSIQGGNNVAGIVYINLATLENSTVRANITGTANIGGIAAANSGSISNCAFDGGAITVNQAASAAANAGAIAGTNNAIITNSFSMGSITSAAGADVIGGLVGVNNSAGIIGPAYARTAVTGGNNIGGFAGTNAGAISNAYSAGKVTVAAGATQTGIFCGTNTGTLTDTFADKAMAGKSTFALFSDAATTDSLLNMTCFDPAGTANTVFTMSAGATAYPQLTAIRALDDGYAMGAYIPQKYQLLIGYSVLSSAAINTKYSQYIDTLPLSTANPVSSITTPETWMGNVGWGTSNSSIITAAGTTGSTGGAPVTLTASILLNTSNGKEYTISMPIVVQSTIQNPNFAGGVGSSGIPYQIASSANFDSLAYYGPDAQIYYVLTNDINYAGSCPAVPITEFDGHLNGQYLGQKYTVYDVTLTNNAGLFGHLNTASSIINLGLTGARSTFVSPDGYIGLLAGHAQGATITNCYAIGEINADAAFMGGLVGLANENTVITGCMTSGKFTNTSDDPAALTGGIAGSADLASVTGCLSTAYVMGEGVVGGIVGEAINASTITANTFAGMAMDPALAGGASIPAITTIGNIAGSIIDGYTTGENPQPIITTTINNCLFDRQITLVPDANATAKFTAELLTGGTAYTVHAGLAGGSTKFAAGVSFGSMPVRFLLGSTAGSMNSFSSISLPGAIGPDAVSVRENPQHMNEYFIIGSGNPIIITLEDNIDLADVYAGMEIELNTDAGAVFDNMNNDLIRYAVPRLSRIIKVTYTLTNATGNVDLNSETAAVMIKNTHTFAGEPVTTTSDVFTTPASQPALLEDLIVSAGGIYAAGELPEGFNYSITAQDQGNAYLLGSAGSGVALASTGGQYGCYIPLSDDTTEIKIHYTIVSDIQWGVFTYWSSLVDTLA